MREAEDLRKLAAWYREFAERAGNPTIWEARLRTAEDLEREADLIDSQPSAVVRESRGDNASPGRRLSTAS